MRRESRVFADRAAAGRELAVALRKLHLRGRLLVLGLPRGGVPVAFEVARALRAPLDVLCVRKIGLPGQPEFAIGALAVGEVLLRTADASAISEAEFQALARRERIELERRAQAYRAGRAPLDLAGQQVILVDDGLATGTTMQAAVRSARHAQAASVTIAVPVASASALELLAEEADHICCLEAPSEFMAVGQFYRHFDQTDDAEVRELLQEAAHINIPPKQQSASTT